MFSGRRKSEISTPAVEPKDPLNPHAQLAQETHELESKEPRDESSFDSGASALSKPRLDRSRSTSATHESDAHISGSDGALGGRVHSKAHGKGDTGGVRGVEKIMQIIPTPKSVVNRASSAVIAAALGKKVADAPLIEEGSVDTIKSSNGENDCTAGGASVPASLGGPGPIKRSLLGPSRDRFAAGGGKDDTEHQDKDVIVEEKEHEIGAILTKEVALKDDEKLKVPLRDATLKMVTIIASLSALNLNSTFSRTITGYPSMNSCSDTAHTRVQISLALNRAA
jgi:hypothetical protein